jgi:hypothetical protein
MHGGYHDDENQKRDKVDTASIREKVTLAQSEKWRILKNITCVSVAFMVQFTAFQVRCLELVIFRNRLKRILSTGNSKSPVIDQRQRLTRNNFAECYLRCTCGFVHFPSDFDHPKADGEMGAFLQHDVLCSLHCGAVLSTILHSHSGRRRSNPKILARISTKLLPSRLASSWVWEQLQCGRVKPPT